MLNLRKKAITIGGALLLCGTSIATVTQDDLQKEIDKMREEVANYVPKKVIDEHVMNQLASGVATDKEKELLILERVIFEIKIAEALTETLKEKVAVLKKMVRRDELSKEELKNVSKVARSSHGSLKTMDDRVFNNLMKKILSQK